LSALDRIRRPAPLSPVVLGLAAVTLLLADLGDQLVGGATLAGAPLDEIAHVLTTLLVLWAIGGPLYERMLLPALVASVAIDADHIPGELGAQILTAGTPRPYTHSLLTVVLVAGAARLWPRRHELLTGVAVGLAIHLWRDMAEPGTGVALLWPASDASWSLSHVSYLVVMGFVVLVGWRRCAEGPARTRVAHR
jgi:inner membrane protein